MKNYLTYGEYPKILEPLYKKCPQIKLLRIKGEDKVKKTDFVAVIITAICSEVCLLKQPEELCYSNKMHTFAEKLGIFSGVCDDITSWVGRGGYITKQEAQIIIDNTCDYLSIQNQN